MTGSAGFGSAGATAAARHSGLSLVYAARGVRGFGDGFATIILPAYLSAIGLDAVRIGIVAAASLLGSAVLTLAVGLRAPRYDLRHLLLTGAILMALTGIALPTFEHFGFIILVVFVGTVNASAGDVGVLVPLEHAMLAQSVPDHERTGTFARYSLIGALTTAAGTLAAAAPDFLSVAGMDHLVAFKSMFYAYAALGLVSVALYGRLPRVRAEAPHRMVGLGPSRGIVYRLAALFSLDAFAGGFAVQSLLALWLFQRFKLSLPAVSAFFFWSSLFSAFSYPVAVRIAARIGLINTMVFTHIPSSICLILAAISSNAIVATALLLIRSALSQMDVPTRTSYVMAVVTPPERTAAASVTAVPRSLASSISPAIAGLLLTTPSAGLPFLVCGCLKITYDLILLLSFRHIRPPEEQSS